MKIEFTGFDEVFEGVDKLLEEAEAQALEEAFDEAISDLISGLDSADVQRSVNRINDFYRKKGVKDEDGNIVQVSSPAAAVKNMTIKRDKLIGQIELSSEEERWFRSDKLYGENILKKLGFDYNNLSY